MYQKLKENFIAHFGKSPEFIITAPGRTELGGNHTDHQNGCVLAAAVELEIKAAVAENGLERIRIVSDGYVPFEVKLCSLSPTPVEAGSSAAIVRGMAAMLREKGAMLRGFDAYITSDIKAGNGLSSSAAFEVLIETIIARTSGFEASSMMMAIMAQKAENVYFGKPCGLMDQATCAIGGVVFLDFRIEGRPIIRPLSLDLSTSGHSLCVIDSGTGHTDKTADYAALTADMESVAAFFGRQKLRQVNEKEFFERLPEVSSALGERATRRARHFFDENRRVLMEAKALELGDFSAFLELVRRSGRSSRELLQNTGEAEAALDLAERLLCGRGAVRIHGGGFGGSIQAYVPNDMLEGFAAGIEKSLGKSACTVLTIRDEGARIFC